MRHELNSEDVELIRQQVNTHFVHAAYHFGNGWRAELLFDVAKRVWVVRDHGREVVVADHLEGAVSVYNKLQPHAQ